MSTYRLISWGANSHGQLGQGILSEQCILPQEADITACPLKPEAIKKIVGGAGHTLILDTNGRIYCCGWNNKGQTGNGKQEENVLTFQRVDALKHERIIDVCCGWDSSAALTRDGELYVWGSNRYGQLGLDPAVFPSVLLPRRVSIGTKIKRVAMGLRHTAVVTENHELYTCGANNKRQLGLINPETMEPYTSASAFTKVSELVMQGNVENVACGQHHTVVTRSEKDLCDVYVFGDNKHGQLGFSPKTPNMQLPQSISTSRFNMPVQIHAGWSHTNILSNGAIFSWGRNDYGQLGRSSSNVQNETSVKEDVLRIEHIPTIVQLSVGSEHNIAVTGDKTILCWGWNEHGNCGNGSTKDLLRPEFLPIPPNFIGILVGAGAGHSFAVIKSVT
ncbi:secretion-regulating guanine nucleotide exchange factor isoform X2 [Ooceraea biroi]|nr:secretion-regulating guanine nucleotide exchange factor isoform X2 [Ooceraea biroi]XP_011350717.2 secretion-regulating guanine nucleotide exchange factor isoform X2 [Ooceraea biroi]